MADVASSTSRLDRLDRDLQTIRNELQSIEKAPTLYMGRPSKQGSGGGTVNIVNVSLVPYSELRDRVRNVSCGEPDDDFVLVLPKTSRHCSGKNHVFKRCVNVSGQTSSVSTSCSLSESNDTSSTLADEIAELRDKYGNLERKCGQLEGVIDTLTRKLEKHDEHLKQKADEVRQETLITILQLLEVHNIRQGDSHEEKDGVSTPPNEESKHEAKSTRDIGEDDTDVRHPKNEEHLLSSDVESDSGSQGEPEEEPSDDENGSESAEEPDEGNGKDDGPDKASRTNGSAVDKSEVPGGSLKGQETAVSDKDCAVSADTRDVDTAERDCQCEGISPDPVLKVDNCTCTETPEREAVPCHGNSDAEPANGKEWVSNEREGDHTTQSKDDFPPSAKGSSESISVIRTMISAKSSQSPPSADTDDHDATENTSGSDSKDASMVKGEAESSCPADEKAEVADCLRASQPQCPSSPILAIDSLYTDECSESPFQTWETPLRLKKGTVCTTRAYVTAGNDGQHDLSLSYEGSGLYSSEDEFAVDGDFADESDVSCDGSVDEGFDTVRCAPYAFQEEAAAWIIEKERSTCGGIIADPPGTGMITSMQLAFVGHNERCNDDEESDPCQKMSTLVVLATASDANHWISTANVVDLTGDSLPHSIPKPPSEDAPDIVVVSKEQLLCRRLNMSLLRRRWTRIVVDVTFGFEWEAGEWELLVKSLQRVVPDAWTVKWWIHAPSDISHEDLAIRYQDLQVMSNEDGDVNAFLEQNRILARRWDDLHEAKGLRPRLRTLVWGREKSSMKHIVGIVGEIVEKLQSYAHEALGSRNSDEELKNILIFVPDTVLFSVLSSELPMYVRNMDVMPLDYRERNDHPPREFFDDAENMIFLALTRKDVPKLTCSVPANTLVVHFCVDMEMNDDHIEKFHNILHHIYPLPESFGPDDRHTDRVGLLVCYPNTY